MSPRLRTVLGILLLAALAASGLPLARWVRGTARGVADQARMIAAAGLDAREAAAWEGTATGETWQVPGLERAATLLDGAARASAPLRMRFAFVTSHGDSAAIEGFRKLAYRWAPAGWGTMTTVARVREWLATAAGSAADSSVLPQFEGVDVILFHDLAAADFAEILRRVTARFGAEVLVAGPSLDGRHHLALFSGTVERCRAGDPAAAAYLGLVR